MLRNAKSRALCVAFLLLATAGGLISCKVGRLGYSVTAVKPEDGCHVKLTMTFQDRDEEISIRATLPEQWNQRQEVKHERETSGILRYAVYSVSQGRIGRWYGRRRPAGGKEQLLLSFA